MRRGEDDVKTAIERAGMREGKRRRCAKVRERFSMRVCLKAVLRELRLKVTWEYSFHRA